MFKVNKTDSRSGAFIVDFGYFTRFSIVCIVDFEQVNVYWAFTYKVGTVVSQSFITRKQKLQRSCWTVNELTANFFTTAFCSLNYFLLYELLTIFTNPTNWVWKSYWRYLFVMRYAICYHLYNL